jgi:hypothetical protein
MSFVPLQWLQSRRISLLCLLLSLALGCSEGDKLTEVKGTLYIGDQPSQRGMGYVTFHPDASKGNTWMEEGVGTVQPDGTYFLESRGTKGVAPGWYKVGITVADVLDPNNPYVTKWLMPNPEKYQYWSKSGISVEVVEKPQPGQYDIKLPALGGQPAPTAPATKS